MTPPSSTVFVTGGAGFIGSALVRRLVQQTDRHIVNIDKLTYAGNLDSLAAISTAPNYTFEKADIADAARMRELFDRFQPDSVVHLAAESHVDRSIDGPAPFIETNIVGTFVLLQEALRQFESKRHFRFLHVSTDEVFGSLDTFGRFSPTTPYDPSSPYSASKAASDHLARAWQRTYGLPVVVTNCSNNYGPYHFPEKLIPLTILKGLSGQPMPVYGKGENIRDWLYVEDHVEALQLALDQGEPGQTYLIGGNAERRNIDVVREICALLDELAPTDSKHEELITFVPDRPGHDLRYAIDASLTHAALKWHPKETFESGLRKTVQWYIDNEEWWQRVQSGAYRGERLGLRLV